MQLGQTNCVPIKAIFTYFGLYHRRTVDPDFGVRGYLKRLFCKMLNMLSLTAGEFQQINTVRTANQGKTINNNYLSRNLKFVLDIVQVS